MRYYFKKLLRLSLLSMLIPLISCSAVGTVTLPDGITADFTLPVWHKSVDLNFTQTETIPTDNSTSTVKTLVFTYKSDLKDSSAVVIDTTGKIATVGSLYLPAR